jgi:hypothetical protein
VIGIRKREQGVEVGPKLLIRVARIRAIGRQQMAGSQARDPFQQHGESVVGAGESGVRGRQGQRGGGGESQEEEAGKIEMAVSYYSLHFRQSHEEQSYVLRAVRNRVCWAVEYKRGAMR